MHPVLHLAHLNPHVAAAVPRAGAFAIPRQQAPSAPWSGAGSALSAWGVSAFAFQVGESGSCGDMESSMIGTLLLS
jgi:hypothetical protein